MSHSIPSEAFKELLFGGAFGLCSGFAVKKLSLPFIAGTVYKLDTNVRSGSCYLVWVLYVEFGVVCVLFVIVIFFYCV